MPEDIKKKRRGPKPDILKINEDWQQAVKRSLKKKRPKSGWPKESTKNESEKGK